MQFIYQQVPFIEYFQQNISASIIEGRNIIEAVKIEYNYTLFCSLDSNYKIEHQTFIDILFRPWFYYEHNYISYHDGKYCLDEFKNCQRSHFRCSQNEMATLF